MRPCDYLSACVNGDVITLLAKGGNHFRINGASTTAFIAGPLTDLQTAVHVSAPPQGARGLLMVTLRTEVKFPSCYGMYTREEWNMMYKYFLLTTGWSNGRPWIELRREWIPSASRMGGLVRSRRETSLQVVVDGVSYTGSRYDAAHSDRPHVPTSDICRYLVGDISASVLIGMARHVPRAN